MSKIFVYYSETGNGDAVASLFKENGYEILKLKPEKPLPKMMFFKMMDGGFQALRNKPTFALPYSFKKEDYDSIVIGTPIWNGRFTPLINTFIFENKLTSFSLVVYSGGGEASKAKERMLNDKRLSIPYYIDLKEPKRNIEAAKSALSEFFD
ncbi:MAG: hypothetical protein WCS80_03735 [Bacilli bacterium]